MIYRNCLKLLQELTHIEEDIQKVEKLLRENSPSVDREGILREVFKDYLESK